MNNVEIEKKMLRLAKDFIEKRYPSRWGGAAVLRTDKNNYLISVAIETCNSGASLCIETGAICEAHKLNERVTHSICLVRDNEIAEFKILTPCGICQERLMYWGNVKVAVTTDDNSLKFVSLSELQRFHWTTAYKNEKLEFYSDDRN
ncbi:MAG: cytidine deaminase [Spirochaetales bacterium]|nr:cytidine deaminase [Spirochaetales bacterium]